MVVLFTIPAVLAGSLLMVKITGSTLNLQSYMGMIMSVGVSISNAVLLITNAEELRMHNGDALEIGPRGGYLAFAADIDDSGSYDRRYGPDGNRPG